MMTLTESESFLLTRGTKIMLKEIPCKVKAKVKQIDIFLMTKT